MPVRRVFDADLETAVEDIDRSNESIIAVLPCQMPIPVICEYGTGWIIVTSRPRTIGDQLAEYRAGDAA